MSLQLARRRRLSISCAGLLCALIGSFVARAHSADSRPSESQKPTPARTAVLARETSSDTVPAQAVDYSGYRGIRRPSPSVYYGYAAYSPYYYGYGYRPWYARPYAYAYGYPGYAGPFYRGWYPRYKYPPVGYAAFGYPGFAFPGYPYAGAWPYAGAFYGPQFAPPVVVGPAVAAPTTVAPPQDSSPRANAPADYVGCYYW